MKIGNFISDFKTVYKGVPQGSILGPVSFNIFINDIFHFIKDSSSLYNYADDNTVSYVYTNPLVLKNVLTNDSLTLVKRFSDNQMQVNLYKFQGIVIGQTSKNENLTSKLGGDCIIYCDKEVKLLGVTIDFKLKFDIHISNICKQLGVSKRIGKNLFKLGKLNIYHSFILSNLSCCPLTWHFYGEANTKKLEKIQERALRFIYNDYVSDYDTLLALSKMHTLKSQRLRTMALEVFKILHKESPVYLRDLYVLKITIMVIYLKLRTKKKKLFFFLFGILEIKIWINILLHKNGRDPTGKNKKIWLKLFSFHCCELVEQHFREVHNFNHFKSLINAWDRGDCVCSFLFCILAFSMFLDAYFLSARFNLISQRFFFYF